MSDTQSEVQFLSEELDKARHQLVHAEAHFKSISTLCAGYHAILFGDHHIPPKDPELVMRAIAYSYAFDMTRAGAKNFVTQDILVDEIPGHARGSRMSVTVQRVEGKSPSQILGELRAAINAVVSALALFDPELANTIALSRIEEIPEVVEKWLKNHAIAANPAQSTPSI